LGIACHEANSTDLVSGGSILVPYREKTARSCENLAKGYFTTKATFDIDAASLVANTSILCT
jgi:hypothetical protein